MSVCQSLERAQSTKPACLLQDIARQVEQGSAKVLQAVDWPQSGLDSGKDLVPEDQSRDSRDSAEHEPTGQVTVCSFLSVKPECDSILVPLSL